MRWHRSKAEIRRSEGGRGEGEYPQLRTVALLILPLRLVADFASGAYKRKGAGERNLMNKIIERIPYAHLLYLLDAGLYCFELLSRVHKNGHHLLAKLSGSVKPKRCSGKNLSDGSYLASVGKTGDTITVRIIPYQIPGFRPARLLTTLLDPAISARELVIHYHRRWDIEIAYDEIKTHLCATLRGRASTMLRSKKPDLVEQELYAVLIVYNLVQELIHQAVAGQYEMVRRISFLDSLQCIIDAIHQLNIAGATQAKTQLQYLRHLIADCVIDRPQRHRVNPRFVKVKMPKFKRHTRTRTIATSTAPHSGFSPHRSPVERSRKHGDWSPDTAPADLLDAIRQRCIVACSEKIHERIARSP
jgi:hypothetical protein